MKKYIQKVKEKKPEDQKKIIHVAAGVVTGIIVVIYLVLRFTILSDDESNPLFDRQSVDMLMNNARLEFNTLGEELSSQRDIFIESREQGEVFKESLQDDSSDLESEQGESDTPNDPNEIIETSEE